MRSSFPARFRSIVVSLFVLVVVILVTFGVDLVRRLSGSSASGRPAAGQNVDRRTDSTGATGPITPALAAAEPGRAERPRDRRDADRERTGEADRPGGRPLPTDEPQGFATFRHMQLSDENGNIPIDAAMRAI